MKGDIFYFINVYQVRKIKERNFWSPLWETFLSVKAEDGMFTKLKSQEVLNLTPGKVSHSGDRKVTFLISFIFLTLNNHLVIS